MDVPPVRSPGLDLVSMSPAFLETLLDARRDRERPCIRSPMPALSRAVHAGPASHIVVVVGHQTDCSRIGNLSTDCWISIRRGSRDGAVVWEGLLAEGATARATGRRLWLRLGAPWNLDARLDGRPLRGLPEDTGNVVVTRRGLGPA